MVMGMPQWMNRCVGLLCGVLAGAEVAHAQAAPPQARLFFQPPVLSDVQLAPDGRRVAMRLRAEGGRDRLAVLDLASMQPTVVADFKDVDVGAVHWVNATRLVFDSQPPLTGPNQADAGPGLFAVNADGSGFRQLVESGLVWVKAPEAGVPLLHWANRLLATLPARGAADVWVVRPGEISKDRIGFFNLQRLDTATGRAVRRGFMAGFSASSLQCCFDRQARIAFPEPCGEFVGEAFGECG